MVRVSEKQSAESAALSDWPRITLRQAGIELIDCDHRTPPASDGGYPYVAIPQLRNGHLQLSEARRITPEHYAEWTKRAKPKPYDVVLSRRCNPGETAVVEPGMEFALGQNLVLLRADGLKAYPPFLRWLVRGPEWWEQINKFINVGAVFESLRCADVPNFELVVPPLEDQQKIAQVLGTLDDKIESNRRMNETLEAMARAIFKSWFVDFDPVRAKAEGRKPFSMDAETAALFPRSFENSSHGKIPKGWKTAPLPEAFHINPLRSLAKGSVTTYLDMQNMPTRGCRPLGWIRRAFVSGSRFKNGDTLIARITPCLENGKTAYVDFLTEGEIGWGSTEFIILDPKPPLPSEYGYCLARDDAFRDFAIQNMTGSSGRQRVPTNCFAQYDVPVPSEPVARRFGKIVRPLFAKIKANAEETTILGAIRGALLPKLLSGELRLAPDSLIRGVR